MQNDVYVFSTVRHDLKLAVLQQFALKKIKTKLNLQTFAASNYYQKNGRGHLQRQCAGLPVSFVSG